MYLLNVRSHFSAAHRLDGYNGACRNLHGHNWTVRVCIACETTDDIGLAVDFKVIKASFHALLDELDHTLLNDLPYFADRNPTSENIARYLYDEMTHRFSHEGCHITEIEVWESENSSVIYRRP
ncbi:MAG: 6-carboxytetrahydropterin synthase QueD [Candidatus Cloacimonetes bacterium]|nr:6-carboxytetrahydropterin synthase QueD [Candidatus Cloacimonadota bacterium]